jgi:hypothetical protein
MGVQLFNENNTIECTISDSGFNLITINDKNVAFDANKNVSDSI